MVHVPDDDLLDRMAALKAEGVPFVVATVIGTRGSTPRKVGAKMVVAGDGRTFGTVGGGAVEALVIERARAVLRSPEVARFEWRLGSEEAGGMPCGGSMEFLLEPFGVRPRAFVFGAGHVGQALTRVLTWLRFDVTVVDPRADLMTEERLSGARLVREESAKAAAQLDIGPDAFCVVATPSHTFDLETMKVLTRRPLRYLGLMASKKKKHEVLQALREDGVTEDALSRVYCPVGLPIKAETPEEIAVSIAAEMVSVLRTEPKSGLAGEVPEGGGVA